MRRIASRWLLSVVLVLGVSSSADAAIIESVEFLTGTDAKVLELGEFGAGNYEVTVTDHLFPEALSVLMFNVVSATESFGSLGEAGSFIFSLSAPGNSISEKSLGTSATCEMASNRTSAIKRRG